MAWIIRIVAIVMAVYHMAATQYLFQAPVEHQNNHLAFALVLMFLTTFGKNRKFWPVTAFFLLLSIICTGYVKVFFRALEHRAGVSPTDLDIVIGLIIVLVSFEATRRAFGWALPVVGALFVGYTFFGHYLPPPFWHFPHDLRQIVTMYSIGLTGMYGTPLSVSTQYIFLFMLFGGLLSASQAAKFLLEIAKLPARKLAGGAGLTAICASGLVGMITGAAAANVGITGPFTIPMMKNAGYKPEQAGAIEAIAATGSAIMPPVLGAVAFVMAGYLNISYWKICLMSIIPAVLYYSCLALYAQLNAMKLSTRVVSTKIDTKKMWESGPPMLVAMLVLIGTLCTGFSANFAAFWATIAVVVVSLMRKETRGSLNTWLTGITQGAIGGAQIGVSCAFLGIITASIDLSGLGVKFPALVDALSGGNMWIGLMVVAFITLLMGCGVPPMASYVVIATVSVPALVRMGVNLEGAHFFLFFYSTFALITPPVAMANLVAAALAKANYWKLSLEAVKASIVAFFLPFLVIMAPIVILQPQPPLEAAMSIVAAFLLTGSLQVLFVGHYLIKVNIIERMTMFFTSAFFVAFLITKDYFSITAGIILVIIVTAWQVRKKAIIKKGVG